ncbi:MAG TPA: response regulator transcription factor [Aeromonadales bacterium]|nr:response regulator transcription factor [Aeromonadales bacterium]
MTDKAKILVIEDEAAIRNGIIDVLVYHGFEADAAEDGVSGLTKALTGAYDLILLDIMLPGKNGFEICQSVRQKFPEQAIIMLTAKTAEEDIIEGLSSGADDYVAKPFSVTQLMLRIKAVLRRTKVQDGTDDKIILGPEVTLDPLNLTGDIHGSLQKFTRKEMDILTYLRAHPKRPVPRNELLNKVWGYDPELVLETRTVDIHVAKIRRKLEKKPSNPIYLLTIRGAGYRLMTTTGSDL